VGTRRQKGSQLDGNGFCCWGGTAGPTLGTESHMGKRTLEIPWVNPSFRLWPSLGLRPLAEFNDGPKSHGQTAAAFRFRPDEDKKP